MPENDLSNALTKLNKLKTRPDGVTAKDWAKIRKGVKELVKRRDAPFDPQRHKAETQTKLATTFIRWYFAILVLILIYVPVYNWVAVTFLIKEGQDPTAQLLGVKDAFIMVSSAVGPMLAFVLGHYFKGKD